MGIGVSIFLIALGAILYFAVDYTMAGVDIDVVGIILMVVGVIGLVVALVMNQQERNTSHRHVEERRIQD